MFCFYRFISSAYTGWLAQARLGLFLREINKRSERFWAEFGE